MAILNVHDTHEWQVEKESPRKIVSPLVGRVVECTIDRKGQILLEPDIELEGWWTSLTLPAEKIITLNEAHDTS